MTVLRNRFREQTKFLSRVMNPDVVHYLYLGTSPWEIIRIAQYSMTPGLWKTCRSHNPNMFITPLSMTEYVVAQMISAAVKASLLFILIAFHCGIMVRFPVQHAASGQSESLLFANLPCSLHCSSWGSSFDRDAHPGASLGAWY